MAIKQGSGRRMIPEIPDTPEMRAQIAEERKIAKAEYERIHTLPSPEPIKKPEPIKLYASSQLDELRAKETMLIEEVARAREEGDLKENAGYHAAREALAMVRGQIAQLVAGGDRPWKAGQKVLTKQAIYQIVAEEPKTFLVRGERGVFSRIPKVKGAPIIGTLPRVDFTPEQAKNFLDLFWNYFPNVYEEHYNRLQRITGGDPSSIELVNLLNIQAPTEFQETLASYFRIHGERSQL